MSSKITGISSPTLLANCATKAYIDSLIVNTEYIPSQETLLNSDEISSENIDMFLFKETEMSASNVFKVCFIEDEDCMYDVLSIIDSIVYPIQRMTFNTNEVYEESRELPNITLSREQCNRICKDPELVRWNVLQRLFTIPEEMKVEMQLKGLI